MARVLLIENGDARRETMRYLLASAGHRVIEAANCDVALKRLRDSPSRLVVVFSISFVTPNEALLLATIDADPRLRTYHAFILLTPFPGRISPDLWKLLTRVGVLVLQRPLHDQLLANAIMVAAHSLRSSGDERARR